MSLKFGIDVSYCQGNIDWDKVKDGGDVEFTIIRDGYSYGDRYEDKRFFDNVDGARRVGIEIYGIYHFSYALSVADAKKEAADAIARARKAGLPETTPIFFDFEYDSSDFCKENGVEPDTAFVRSVTQAFCDEVRASGYVPGVYVNPDYYERVYKNVLPDNIVVWAAKWITWGDSYHEKKPKFLFDVWQYGITHIKGFDGDIDGCVILDEVKMESKKSNEEIAKEVVRGDWGNGAERRKRLEEAGYNYRDVQKLVNQYFDK